MFQVRFWGVRGSIPCPGPDTVIYGGNTACIEIRAGERLIIVDLGSGVRPLGDYLLKEDSRKFGKVSADIFITHTHWDHIMGFPMFTPIYINNTELRITGPDSPNKSLKEIFELQLSYNYWPVQLENLSAKIEYNQIKETTISLDGDLTVTSKFLNHPTECLGYRFNYEGKSITIIYDHEPFPDKERNQGIIDFIKETDLLIHDAQYTDEEYTTRIGWGHSTMITAIQTAVSAKVKKLVLFHHDPSRQDDLLEKYEKRYESIEVPCVMAREGMLLDI